MQSSRNPHHPHQRIYSDCKSCSENSLQAYIDWPTLNDAVSIARTSTRRSFLRCSAILEQALKDHYCLPASNSRRTGKTGANTDAILPGELQQWPRAKRTARIHIAVALARELRVWATLEHPNVLPLIGFRLAEDYREAWLVSPIMPNGNVRQYFKRINPDTQRRTDAVVEMTKGLAYLHGLSPPVCHGDLKPDNLLVDNQGHILLCDFGLTVVPDSDPSGLTTTKSLRGTVRYLAPELLETETPARTLRSDIWAWGCVVIELLTDRIPYANLSGDYHVMRAIMEGDSPPVPFGMPLEPIVNWACRMAPFARPDVHQCLGVLTVDTTPYQHYPWSGIQSTTSEPVILSTIRPDNGNSNFHLSDVLKSSSAMICSDTLPRLGYVQGKIVTVVDMEPGGHREIQLLVSPWEWAFRNDLQSFVFLAAASTPTPDSSPLSLLVVVDMGGRRSRRISTDMAPWNGQQLFHLEGDAVAILENSSARFYRITGEEARRIEWPGGKVIQQSARGFSDDGSVFYTLAQPDARPFAMTLWKTEALTPLRTMAFEGVSQRRITLAPSANSIFLFDDAENLYQYDLDTTPSESPLQKGLVSPKRCIYTPTMLRKEAYWSTQDVLRSSIVVPPGGRYVLVRFRSRRTVIDLRTGLFVLDVENSRWRSRATLESLPTFGLDVVPELVDGEETWSCYKYEF